MTLSVGSMLGPYEITAPIGSGGMGEVYKARDTRLDRTVAIKVLPSHLADNLDLKQRFEREARAVSSLNHPHICTLYDIGEQDGTDYLVMEYIEGESLAERLKKAAVPLDQALRYAVEIADALDKAHRQGVVHRDLKPGNIMLTKSGAKLMDFGLAKLKASEPSPNASVLSALPTEQRPLTKEGSILGTFQYMAPEQLEGKDVDARTDIFAFGAVLYEMVTGRRAFEGKSQASLIVAIMEHEPTSMSQLQPMSPPSLERVVKTCMSKDPDERWQSAGDVERQLKWIAEGGTAAGVAAQVVAPTPTLWKRALTVALALLVGAVVTGVAVWSLMRPGPEAVRRFTINVPATDRLDSGLGIALSADGSELVYVATHDGVRQLYRRSMDQLNASPIRGTEGASFPFFSPDGEWVGFYGDGQLKKVSLAGGPPVTLCEAGPLWAISSWEPDDTIIFSSETYLGLTRVSAAGGQPDPITNPASDQGEMYHWTPDILPGGKAVLFTVWYGMSAERAQIASYSRDAGERRMLVAGSCPRYSPTGHIVFHREGSLWAVPFDAERLEVTGAPTPIIEGVQVESVFYLASFALSGDGSLVYVPVTAATPERKLVLVDRQGVERPLAETLRDYRDPRLSPDGRRLAVRTGGDVWVLEVARGTLTRLTFEGGYRPIWSPAGEWVIFASNREGTLDIFSKAADGSSHAEQLTAGELRIPTSVTPDGKTVVFRQSTATTGMDIGMVRLEGDRNPEMLLQTPFDEHTGMLSPDGSWLAYVSDESGREEIYVRPFPRGGKVQISTEGGTQPMWSRDGKELFYRSDARMMTVAISTETGLAPGKPRLLFEGRYEMGSGPGSNYDVTADGRFVMIRTEESPAPAQINVVLNWSEELKRLVPTS
jgi:Tol biopolymer transport system component/tRNA A-37 threonylcarbamoyl transferase component Bud32